MTEDVKFLLDPIEEALSVLRRGELIVVMDDDDRENEGDLIGVASRITSQQMAFIIRYTSGIVCAPMLAENARRLRLDPMVLDNNAPLGTAFTVSVDYREGLKTGISAEERAFCVHALANGNVSADDFVRPGHVFPLIAQQGGVLMRSGHTEAAVDLCRLIGEVQVGVLAELMNDDGSVKRGKQVVQFAREHGLKVISIADLIAYRQARECLVERISEKGIETRGGVARGLCYATPFDSLNHFALVFGDVEGRKNVPVRFHRENILEDVFGKQILLEKMYEIFRQEGCGVLVYLREGGVGVATPREQGKSAQDREGVWREIGLGAQIIRDLGIKSMILFSTRARHYAGLCGFGIEISETRVLSL